MKKHTNFVHTFTFLTLFVVTLSGCQTVSDTSNSSISPSVSLSAPTLTPISTPPPTSAPISTKAPTPIPTQTLTPVPTASAMPTIAVSPDSSQPSPYQMGTLTEYGYESEWLNLTFIKPETMLMANQSNLDNAMGIAYTKALTERSGQTFDYTELFTLTEMWCGTSHRNNTKVQIIKLSNDFTFSSSEDFLYQYQAATKDSGLYSFGEIRHEEFAGELYATTKMIIYAGDKEWQHVELYIRMKEDRLIQISFSCLIGEEDVIPTLKSGFSSYTAKAAGEPISGQAAISSYSKGLLTEQIFESKWMNITYLKPDDAFLSAPDSLNSSISGDSSFLHSDYIYLPSVSEMLVTASSNGANLGIIVEPLILQGMTMEQYIYNLKMFFKYSTDASYSFTDNISEITITGETYSVFTCTVVYPSGKEIIQSYCMRLKEDRMICIIMSCAPGYQSHLLKLLSGFSTYQGLYGKDSSAPVYH